MADRLDAAREQFVAAAEAEDGARNELVAAILAHLHQLASERFGAVARIDLWILDPGQSDWMLFLRRVVLLSGQEVPESELEHFEYGNEVIALRDQLMELLGPRPISIDSQGCRITRVPRRG